MEIKGGFADLCVIFSIGFWARSIRNAFLMARLVLISR